MIAPSPPEEPGETPAEKEPQPPRDPLEIVNDKPADEERVDLSKLENQFKGLESDTGPMPVEGKTSEEPSTETPEIPAVPPSRSRRKMRSRS